MSEDHNALLSRISLLADRARGRGHPYWHQGRPPRGRGQTLPVAHRHKTLIINNPSSSSSSPAVSGLPESGPTHGSVGSAATAATVTGDGWVAKRDRHMQLINTAVYDKEMEARTKAMAKSREEKLKRREAKEQMMMARYLQASEQKSNHEVVIGGERYKVVANGSKLVRLSGKGAPDLEGEAHILKTDRARIGSATATQTPKKAIVAGVQFTRSKNGNLIRAGFVRASRLQNKQVNEPCKFFSTTGKCKNGKSCRYIHDANKVAICPQFLASGSCPEGECCDLSHEPTAHRVPACHHFLRGNCSNDNCRYAHVRVNPAAPICRAFAHYGYCSDGENCTKRHVHECPEFDEKGTCSDPKCKLQHIERAGKKRAAAAAVAPSATEMSGSGDGVSSTSDDDEDEEEFHSDVDSEDEFLGQPQQQPFGAENDDAMMQLDYIKF